MLKMLANLFAPMDTAQSGVWACEKPTTTLCKMIAATMLQDLPPIDGYDRVRHDKFDIEFYYGFRNLRDKDLSKRWQVRIIYKPERLDLDDREKAILVAAFEKLQKLNKAKAKAEAETRNQERAVDALARWLGVDDKSHPGDGPEKVDPPLKEPLARE